MFKHVECPFSRLISTGGCKEDSRPREEILEGNMKELSDKTLKLHILEMPGEHEGRWKGFYESHDASD